MNMPRMDGPAFAGELQRRGLRPRIPLIVLTGNGFAGEYAAKLGAEGYLDKPFDIRVLLQKVAYLVGD
jgi:CheY-like chemotaxis protein